MAKITVAPSVGQLLEPEGLVGSNVGVRHARSGGTAEAGADGGHHSGSARHPVAARREGSTAEQRESVACGGCTGQPARHAPDRTADGRRRDEGQGTDDGDAGDGRHRDGGEPLSVEALELEPGHVVVE